MFVNKKWLFHFIIKYLAKFQKVNSHFIFTSPGIINVPCDVCEDTSSFVWWDVTSSYRFDHGGDGSWICTYHWAHRYLLYSARIDIQLTVSISTVVLKTCLFTWMWSCKWLKFDAGYYLGKLLKLWNYCEGNKITCKIVMFSVLQFTYEARVFEQIQSHRWVRDVMAINVGCEFRGRSSIPSVCWSWASWLI